jgi:hypothetical protein
VNIALAGLSRVYQAGRPYVEIDGVLVPIVSGGDGVVTVQELVDERARVLTEIDGILDTARSRVEGDATPQLTDEERTRHDELAARFEQIEGEISRAQVVEGDSTRFEQHSARTARPAPIVNLIGRANPPSANRSLDELLWATNEDVAAGSFDKAGRFHPHASARNAIEQVVVRNQDGAGVAAPRLTEFLPEHRVVVREFQRCVADMVLVGLMVNGRVGDNSAAGFEIARSMPQFRDRWQNVLRAMDVDTSAQGTEWVPTGIGAELHEKVRAAGKVAALFPRVDLPTNPWKWPIEGADATAYRVAEPTADNESAMTASTPGTGAATFDAEIFGGRILFSRSLEADSAVAILPYARRKLVVAFVDAEEKAILDGDTDGTHQDSDVGASTTDARTAWDGLRKKAIAQTVATATTTTVANLGLIRAAMGKWGLNPADLAFVIGVSAFHDVIADANVLTVDKMGPQATILNGQLASVHGIPIIVSEHVRENLNASGVYDGITTTKTYNLCVNRGEWAVGQRMALDVEVDDSPYRETFQRLLVGFMREDFQHIGDAATNEDTAIAYNVTP